MRKIFILSSLLLLLTIIVMVILTGKNNALGEEGKRIIFSAIGLGGLVSDIFSMDIDSGNLKNLTNHPKTDDDPSPSPNGKYIAFSSWRNGRPGIFIMDADGKNLKLLIDGVDDRPSWSPDSIWVAFVKGGILVAMNVTSGVLKEIFNPLHILTNFTSWSPDGKKIAFRYLAGLKENWIIRLST